MRLVLSVLLVTLPFTTGETETFGAVVVSGKTKLKCSFTMVYTGTKVDTRKSKAKCSGARSTVKVSNAEITSTSGTVFIVTMTVPRNGNAKFQKVLMRPENPVGPPGKGSGGPGGKGSGGPVGPPGEGSGGSGGPPGKGSGQPTQSSGMMRCKCRCSCPDGSEDCECDCDCPSGQASSRSCGRGFSRMCPVQENGACPPKTVSLCSGAMGPTPGSSGGSSGKGGKGPTGGTGGKGGKGPTGGTGGKGPTGGSSGKGGKGPRPPPKGREMGTNPPTANEFVTELSGDGCTCVPNVILYFTKISLQAEGQAMPPKGRTGPTPDQFDAVVRAGKTVLRCNFLLVFKGDTVDIRRSKAKCTGAKKTEKVTNARVKSSSGAEYSISMTVPKSGKAKLNKVLIMTAPGNEGAGQGSGPPVGPPGKGSGGPGGSIGGPSLMGFMDDCACVDESLFGNPSGNGPPGPGNGSGGPGGQGHGSGGPGQGQGSGGEGSNGSGTVSNVTNIPNPGSGSYETTLSIWQQWSQEPSGYSRTAQVSVPATSADQKVPVVIHLHGNGGQGNTQILGRWLGSDCVIVSADGYERSWNIYTEKSKADDVSFIVDLIYKVGAEIPAADMNNVNIIGTSNGAALTYRLMIETGTDRPFRRVFPMVSSLISPQYHDSSFWKSSASAAPGSANIYDIQVSPVFDDNFEYAHFHGTEDGAIKYDGQSPGPGFLGGADVIAAQKTDYLWASSMGHAGGQLADSEGVSVGTASKPVQQYSYLNGRVRHFKLVGEGHGTGPNHPVVQQVVREAILGTGQTRKIAYEQSPGVSFSHVA